MAVVVLPTPPFWLATTSTRSRRYAFKDGSGLTGTAKPPHAHDATPAVTLGWHNVGFIFPISSSFSHFRHHILSLQEQAGGARLEVWLGIPEQAVERRTSPRRDDLHS